MTTAGKVALLTQYFPPEVYPQTLWLAETLKQQGWRVAVVTSVPNYPTGMVADGYRATRAKFEQVEGTPVLRVPVYPSHDRRAFGRIANYASFAFSSAFQGHRTFAGADVNLVWATPATVGLAALITRFTVGTPYVLYIQDLWPDSVFATGFLTGPSMRLAVEKAMAPYLASLHHHASHIVAITPGMAETLVSRGVDRGRVRVAYNWVDEAVMRPVHPNGLLRGRLGLAPDDFVMVFAGNQGVAQGLDAWVAAMARLPSGAACHLVLVGSGSHQEAIRSRVADLGLESVHFHPQVPIDAVSDLVADADVSVLSLTDSPLFHITMPSKTQAALAQGKAVISSAPGETSQTIAQAHAGWTATPDDPDSIAEAILAARAAGPEERFTRGINGRAFYLERMSRDVGGAKLSEVLRLAAAERKNRRWRR